MCIYTFSVHFCYIFAIFLQSCSHLLQKPKRAVAAAQQRQPPACPPTCTWTGP